MHAMAAHVYPRLPSEYPNGYHSKVLGPQDDWSGAKHVAGLVGKRAVVPVQPGVNSNWSWNLLPVYMS